MMPLSDRAAAEIHNCTNRESDLVGRCFLLRHFGVIVHHCFETVYCSPTEIVHTMDF